MTRLTAFVAGLVVVLAATVSALLAATLLDSDPEHVRPPHVRPADSGRTPGPPPLAAVGGDSPQAVADWIDGVARAEWFAGVEEAERERERQAQAERDAAARAAAPRPRGGGGSCAGDLECFLPCTRGHESDTSGGYEAVSPGGRYRGAYQFDAGTWAGAVTRAGYPEYAHTPADQAPPHVQDAAAAQLYSERGNQPWGGRC